MKLRRERLKQFAVAVEVHSQIEVNAKWSWAKNQENQGELAAREKVIRSKLFGFHQNFISQEPAKVNKPHSPGVVDGELAGFVTVSDVVSELAECTADLGVRHQAVLLSAAAKKARKAK